MLFGVSCLGLCYGRAEYNAYFYDFCRTVFGYQYVQNRTEITPAMVEWLYEHSAGVISVVVALIHDAQEIAILNGTETLGLETLRGAYQHRLTMLHGHIVSCTEQKRGYAPVAKSNDFLLPMREMVVTSQTIAELVQIAKDRELDLVAFLRQHFPVTEVVI